MIIQIYDTHMHKNMYLYIKYMRTIKMENQRQKSQNLKGG